MSIKGDFSLEDYDLGQYGHGQYDQDHNIGDNPPDIPPDIDMPPSPCEYELPVSSSTHSASASNYLPHPVVDNTFHHTPMSGNFGWDNHTGNESHAPNHTPNVNHMGVSMNRRPRFSRPNINMGYGRAIGHQLDPTALPGEFTTLRAGARIPFKFKCFPLIVYDMTAKDSEKDKIRLMQCSNKIIAPNTILQKLCQYGNIQPEHVFQINKMKNRVSIEIYYEYDAYSETNDVIYVPNYIFESLGIEYGDEVELSFINEVIPKGRHIKLQPVTNKIQEVQDYQTFLQQHLQAYYTCLIKGDTIKFPYYDDEILMIIHSLEPNNIVSITNTDLEVDFEPSVEQREKEARIESEMEEKLIADMKRAKEVKQKSEHLKSFGTNMHKLNYDELNSDENYKNQEFMKQPEQPHQSEFVAFQGKGRSLNGKSEPKMDTTKIERPKTSLRFEHHLPKDNPQPVIEPSSFQGEGHSLGGTNKLSNVQDNAKLRRAKFLERLELSKPKPVTEKKEEPTDKVVDNKQPLNGKQFVDELIEQMEVDEPSKPKKPTKKKLKFILKKNKTPKPDFLNQSDDS
jgi:hypothetical protein